MVQGQVIGLYLVEGSIWCYYRKTLLRELFLKWILKWIMEGLNG